MKPYSEIFDHEDSAFVFEDILAIDYAFSIMHCEECAEELAAFETKGEAQGWLEFVISDEQLKGHPTNLGY